MGRNALYLALGAIVLAGCVNVHKTQNVHTNKAALEDQPIGPGPAKVLRHVVLFKFKDGTTPADVEKIETAFAALPGKIEAFTEWFAGRFEEGDREAILDWTVQAPYVRENHPTDEHLMPLFFAYGAAGEDVKAERVHASRQYGFFAWDSWMFH